jgi:hypothetical protein
VTATQACELLAENDGDLSNGTHGASCAALCGSSAYFCDLPSAFVAQVQALNPDAGPAPTDGGPLSLQCPTNAGTQTVMCEEQCLGRLTEGFEAPEAAPRSRQSEGDRLAAMAYLEAVSVHAFARLTRELEALGATPALVRDARRARRDEVRHTAITTRLARKRGGSPRLPDAPPTRAARSVFEVALENAVEGCVRETYGAVAGLVVAQRAREGVLGRAMRSIADDECRHAELAWAVHEWAMPRLSSAERARVKSAMRDAIAEIASRDPRGARLLFGAEDPTVQSLSMNRPRNPPTPGTLRPFFS